MILTITDSDYESANELLRKKPIEEFPWALNMYFSVEGHISPKDADATPPPQYVPANVEAAFVEGATCCVVKCWNAAGAMFRLCVDLATKGLLPAADTPNINKHQRSVLAARLAWLFENSKLPAELSPLSNCIREDGKDGVHDGTLTQADAMDLQDFARVLLERIYTEPEKLKLAQERRIKRREPKANFKGMS